ncbi:FecCD family ABC transporter permease [Nocardia crassostreae]|uniref:FecCD family ABC transporter permease n=1 Tax=Nocardia crassostreae TaxID=53428 RepID=UPI000A06A500|nr:iron ABC transporter permease [Nocardia crassostreae]
MSDLATVERGRPWKPSRGTGDSKQRKTAPTTAARRRRTALLGVLCTAALAILTTIALTSGEMAMPVATALRAAVGFGDAGDIFVVREFRMPRLAAGVLAGAALAVSGAVLQRLLRNPLASPDLIGVTGGSSVGAVAILALGAGQTLIPLGAFGGGLLAAALLGGLGRAGLPLTRLIVVGLAVQTGLQAAVNLFVVRFPAELASSAKQWTTGSLYGRTWTEVTGAAIACVVVIALLFLQYRTLAALDLGDESAGVLGISAPKARLRLLVTAVVLASLAAALTGPIAFVALAVPQLVRMLVGPPTAATMVVTGLAGATLLVGCDQLAQHVLPGGVPVGVVTATVGAPWLLYLMLRESGPAHRRTS